MVYPNSSAAHVSFAPGEPLRSGYVLMRSAGNVRVAIVSGTSVTQGRIDAISAMDDGLSMPDPTRQEIFLAEGRRFADPGTRTRWR